MAKDKNKSKLFVEAMVANGGNRTKAAQAAGHKPGRASEKAGERYMKDPATKRLLKARQAQALKAARITANDTMASLARDLNFDPARLFDEDGRLKKIHELDPDTRMALRGVDVDDDGTLKIKFPEKTAAREQAMKHFGLYERDNKQKPFYTPPQLVIVGRPGRGGK